ncbi:MAG: hypothetical protein HY319_07325 [Armatimonadetes bacterium]|nr:hypothetical protein [Armatimonadota bacterium]
MLTSTDPSGARLKPLIWLSGPTRHRRSPEEASWHSTVCSRAMTTESPKLSAQLGAHPPRSTTAFQRSWPSFPETECTIPPRELTSTPSEVAFAA